MLYMPATHCILVTHVCTSPYASPRIRKKLLLIDDRSTIDHWLVNWPVDVNQFGSSVAIWVFLLTKWVGPSFPNQIANYIVVKNPNFNWLICRLLAIYQWWNHRVFKGLTIVILLIPTTKVNVIEIWWNGNLHVITWVSVLASKFIDLWLIFMWFKDQIIQYISKQHPNMFLSLNSCTFGEFSLIPLFNNEQIKQKS